MFSVIHSAARCAQMTNDSLLVCERWYTICPCGLHGTRVCHLISWRPRRERLRRIRIWLYFCFTVFFPLRGICLRNVCWKQGGHKPGILRDFSGHGKLREFCATSGKNCYKQSIFSSSFEYLCKTAVDWVNRIIRISGGTDPAALGGGVWTVCSGCGTGITAGIWTYDFSVISLASQWLFYHLVF